jgi:DnaJ-class molecular chaperone
MVLVMATTTPPVDLVSPLLGTPSCSPVVGRTNNCSSCEGGGIVGDERSHRSCPDCHGTGLAWTLEQLIESRSTVLRWMHEAHARGEIDRRESLRAEVAELDVMIASMRRAA